MVVDVVGPRQWAAEVWRGTAERQSAVAWLLSGVPDRCLEWRLSMSPLARGRNAGLVRRMTAPGVPEAAPSPAVAVEWEGWWCQSWYLWGETGVGKTGLAVGYAYQWVDPALGGPGRVVFVSVPDLLGRLRASYGARGRVAAGRGEEAVRACREADLLVLDDLGAEYDGGSGWVESVIGGIVAYRHAQMLPIVVTSNVDLAQLAGRLSGGEGCSRGDRVAWRLVEMCGAANVVRVVGRNLRDGKG